MDKPWEDEPDYEIGKFCNLTYEVKRNLDTGSLCGYVTIPKENQYSLAEDYDAIQGIDVHGGWTYGEHEEDGSFVVGFDCAHAGDLIPMMAILKEQIAMPEHNFEETYKDFEYVKDQCKRACWQFTGNTFTSDLNEALYQRYSNGE